MLPSTVFYYSKQTTFCQYRLHIPHRWVDFAKRPMADLINALPLITLVSHQWENDGFTDGFVEKDGEKALGDAKTARWGHAILKSF